MIAFPSRQRWSRRFSCYQSRPKLRLNTFIHSSHADFPAPNEKVATFLRDQEATFGSSIVERRDDERYAAAFSFLIQLLCEYSDDLETVVGSVRLTPWRGEKLEKGVRGR